MSNRLVGIYTITPLHCGTGQAVGAIDQPVVRERHTGHPLIPAPSIKGRLRALAEERARNDGDEANKVIAVFGPDTDKGDDHASAVTLTDARLVAFPVRSLQAVFFWVTCPMVLNRFQRDVTEARIDRFNLRENFLANGNVMVSGDIIDTANLKTLLVLEDLVYQDEIKAKNETAKKWAGTLQRLIPNTDPNHQAIENRLVILPDQDFTDLVMRTTPVTARILLNNDSKTTSEGGNLWYEETVPPDSLFYAFFCPRNASGKKKMDESAVSNYVQSLKPSPIQLGGNETVGQGWCHFHWVEEQ